VENTGRRVESTGRPTLGVTASDAEYRAVFDRLFEGGRYALLSGGHYRDTPPVADGRWGPSIVLVPSGSGAQALAAVTAEAMSLAGPAHWPTGAPHAVHITVRAMRAHVAAVPAADPFLTRCAAAMRRAAASTSGPARFRFGGLTLTPSGVMACAYPVDGAADEIARRLREELGEDAWFEANFHRDIWYATLVHFAADIADPAALVEWVAQRRDLDLEPVVVREVELLRFDYDGRQPVRVPLATAPLREP
jgi:hypothetical protein